MGKYFGTDGIRGIAGRELTPEFALRAGRAVGSVLRATYRGAKLPYFGQVDDQLPHPCVLLGRDTRMSSPMLADAVRSGLLSAGVSVADLGIVPTPLVGLMANRFNALGGVMITASHNPVDHNGIKVFRSDGLKIGGRTVAAIEARIDEGGGPSARRCGESLGIDVRPLYRRYLERLNGVDGQGTRVALDLAHGAACATALEVFRGFGYDPVPVCDEPDGSRINVRCGATDLRRLRQAVRESGAEWGFAFDGDADRVMAVDGRGRVVDGDLLMSLLVLRYPAYRKNAALVFTQMSNFGVEQHLRSQGIRTYRTDVGDGNVLAAMRRRRVNLGGEQSGHIICWDKTCCGDGVLVALFVSELLVKSGLSLAEFADSVPVYPQELRNVPMADNRRWRRDERFLQKLERIQSSYGGEVRFYIRPSGTEGVVRVLTEARTAARAKQACREACELFSTYRRR